MRRTFWTVIWILLVVIEQGQVNINYGKYDTHTSKQNLSLLRGKTQKIIILRIIMLCDPLKNNYYELI